MLIRGPPACGKTALLQAVLSDPVFKSQFDDIVSVPFARLISYEPPITPEELVAQVCVLVAASVTRMLQLLPFVSLPMCACRCKQLMPSFLAL